MATCCLSCSHEKLAAVDSQAFDRATVIRLDDDAFENSACTSRNTGMDIYCAESPLSTRGAGFLETMKRGHASVERLF
jgi:hypothetical protein